MRGGRAEDVESMGASGRVMVPGRPLLVGGEPRVAPPSPTQGWAFTLAVQAAALSEAERAVAGKAWEAAGRMEHASVAAFARFVLQLTSVAAPASMVASAAGALQDEIRHARLSFAVAAAFLGRPVGVGELELRGVLEAHPPEEILLSTIAEGCLGETFSAAQAAEAAKRCDDPAIRSALLEIASDEQRHAELAWHFVEWMLAAHPDLAGSAREAFQSPVPAERPAASPDEALLSRIGQPGPLACWEIASRAWRDAVRPRAASLLGEFDLRPTRARPPQASPSPSLQPPL